jgi:hypothetical protein
LWKEHKVDRKSFELKTKAFRFYNPTGIFPG